jgi:hypothetical protein
MHISTCHHTFSVFAPASTHFHLVVLTCT